MALQIAPTPVLKGKEAEKFLKKLQKKNWHKNSLVSSSKFDELCEEILADAREAKK
jgi:hypothetical protein